MNADRAPVAAQEKPAPRYTVSVRALCEFTAKQGDLDLRFTPTPPPRKVSPVTPSWRSGAARATRAK
jgi:hypothetical protein